MRTTLTAVLVAVASVSLGVGIAASPVKALEPVPAPKITCVANTVHVGDTVHCVVTGTEGLVPADKITWTNPLTHSTINVWNGQGQTFNINYTVPAGQVNRNLTLSATVYVPTFPGSRIVKPYAGYTIITVIP